MKTANGIEGTFMDEIAADVAGGLLHLQEKGIAHRASRLANVLVINHCCLLVVIVLS